MEKKKKRTLQVLAILNILFYIIFEILWLYMLYSQAGTGGVVSEKVAGQIKQSGNLRNIFELGVYIIFVIYSWCVWSYSSEKRYAKYIIRTVYVILAVFALGAVFMGIQYLVLGAVNGNHFFTGIILVWFDVMMFLLVSGMQAKKDKQQEK